MEDMNKITKTVNQRYWLFSIGFVVSGLGVAAAIAMFNPYLGAACLLAELTYFNYVNMVNVGDIRHRLKVSDQYTKKLAALPVDTDTATITAEAAKVPHGQYL